MENKIIDVTTEEMAMYEEAVNLHHEIMVNGTIAAQALCELCRCLKRMRDEKLYTSLGYDDFETYCEEKVNIKKRQAHNYIKAYEDLGNEFLQSNAQLGITKLELITHVPAVDRSEFLENNDVEEISVSELKKRIEELEQENCMKGEQLNMLQEQVSSYEDSQSEDRSEEIDDLKAEIERLKSEPKASGKEITKIKKELKAKAKEEQDKAVRAAIDKERKAIADEHRAEIENATAELQNQIEGYKKKLEAQQENMSEAVKKAAELEKKLQDARTDNTMKFRLLFEQFQNGIENLFDSLEAVEDPEKKKDFAGKLTELGENITAAAREFC